LDNKVFNGIELAALLGLLS